MYNLNTKNKVVYVYFDLVCFHNPICEKSYLIPIVESIIARTSHIGTLVYIIMRNQNFPFSTKEGKREEKRI